MRIQSNFDNNKKGLNKQNTFFNFYLLNTLISVSTAFRNTNYFISTRFSARPHRFALNISQRLYSFFYSNKRGYCSDHKLK